MAHNFFVMNTEKVLNIGYMFINSYILSSSLVIPRQDKIQAYLLYVSPACT